MVRPPENVLIFPRRERRASSALLRLMLSASSPVRDRRVVVTISERFGKAIAYPLWVRPSVPPGVARQRLVQNPRPSYRSLTAAQWARPMAGGQKVKRPRLGRVVLFRRWLSPVLRLSLPHQRL